MSDEQLSTIIEQNETLISIQENIDTQISVQDSTINSQISTMDSKNDSNISYIQSQISVLNSNLENINNSQGGYTKEQVLANNEAFYSDFVYMKEGMTFQFIFIGVLIAGVIITLIVKGFFKHVSN